jgi:hypothetical protein
LGDRQTQVGPPPSPIGRIAYRGTDARRIGGDVRLVGNLKAVHGN